MDAVVWLAESEDQIRRRKFKESCSAAKKTRVENESSSQAGKVLLKCRRKKLSFCGALRARALKVAGCGQLGKTKVGEFAAF